MIIDNKHPDAIYVFIICVSLNYTGSKSEYTVSPYYPAYTVTPLSRVLLDKLSVSQPVKKFLILWNRRFITAYQPHASLSWTQ